MMELPIEVLVYLFKYLPKGDRLAASETCRLWYEAANEKCFLSKKHIVFHKNAVGEEHTEPLTVFEDSPVSYTNYIFNEVEITGKFKKFWRKLGPNMKSLCLNNCDICEKVFVYLLKHCPVLEELIIQGCRELFMSGRLMEGNTEGLSAVSLDSLKILSLSGNRYLSDALFNRFVTSAPLLEELNLSSCSLSFHLGLVKKFYPAGGNNECYKTASESVLTFHYILQFIISRAKYLKRLSFSQTLIDGSALKLLSEVEDLALESLHVHSCDQLTNAGILALSTHQIHLRELDVGLCTRVTDQSLVHICGNLINLELLNIQRCRAVTDLGVFELQKLKKLASLNISQCELITVEGFKKGICPEENHILKYLNINSLNIDERAIIMISEKLPNLRSLDISFCFNAITDTSIQVIFKNQIYLNCLKLSHCDKVSDAGLTGMGNGQEIDENDGPIMSGFEEPSTFQRIYLGSRAEGEIVRDARRKHDVMKMCENISTDTYSGYSLARLRGLTELDISGCNRITDVSLTYAFNLKELVTLNLSRCQQITHEGIGHLVKNCPSVENCDLIDCYNLKDDAVTYIVKGFRRLKQLHLRGCNQLTDKSLEAVRSHCAKLKVLDVQGCRNISPELATSLTSLPSLHTVIMSKPGPYLNEGVKERVPAPPLLPTLMRRLRLH